MAPSKSTAVAWNFVQKDGSNFSCQLCGHNFTGTLTGVVDHLLGISNGSRGGVEACTKITDEQKATVEKDHSNSQMQKQKRVNKGQQSEREIAMSSSNTINSVSNIGGSSSTQAKTGGTKTSNQKATVEKEHSNSQMQKQKRVNKGQQSEKEIAMSSSNTINSVSNIGESSSTQAKTGGTKTSNQSWKPVEKQEVDDAVAEFFYACEIPVNVAMSPYFKNVIKKAIDFGKGYVPPGSEALGTTLLKRAKDRVTGKLADIKESWKLTGCTILCNGCSDLCPRPSIDVLVYCPRGVFFLRTINAMDQVKTSEFIFGILDEAIQEVGEENVVHVVTDNASNCVGVETLIKEKYKQIYWTPCVAHSVYLMLHDLAEFPWVNETIQNAKTISNFIINHRLTISIYRKNASKKLLAPCDTRFATFYTTLKRVVEEKASVRAIFGSFGWKRSTLSKETQGKLVEQIVLNNGFWKNANKVLKICGPIVNVLRRVDGDKPCLGFVYESIDRCKETIATAFNNVEADYKEIWDLIDHRGKMMHSPLHAAACCLDPRLFGSPRHMDEEIKNGLTQCIEKLNPDPAIAGLINRQLSAYRLEEGLFGTQAAKHYRTVSDPALWWQFHGVEAPELKKFAIRILSQGTSASACSFDHIRSKKGTGRLKDLVYVRSNLQLALKNLPEESSNSFYSMTSMSDSRPKQYPTVDNPCSSYLGSISSRLANIPRRNETNKVQRPVPRSMGTVHSKLNDISEIDEIGISVSSGPLENWKGESSSVQEGKIMDKKIMEKAVNCTVKSNKSKYDDEQEDDSDDAYGLETSTFETSTFDLSQDFGDFVSSSSDLSEEWLRLLRFGTRLSSHVYNPNNFRNNNNNLLKEPVLQAQWMSKPAKSRQFEEERIQSEEETVQSNPYTLSSTTKATSEVVKALVDDLRPRNSKHLQWSAAQNLRLLAKNKMENRMMIAKAGAVRPLINLLRSTDPQIQEAAVTALLNLSLCDDNNMEISQAGAIEPLIHVLKAGTSVAKQNAACALLRLSLIDGNKVTIGDAGAIPPLVALLISGSSQEKKDAATTLYRLSSRNQNKVMAINAGAIKSLIELMADSSSGMVDKAVAVLSNLASELDGKNAIVAEGGIPVLVKIIESGSQEGREFATQTLKHLCSDNYEYRTLVLRGGAIPPLVVVSKSGTAKAKHNAVTLLQYLCEKNPKEL